MPLLWSFTGLMSQLRYRLLASLTWLAYLQHLCEPIAILSFADAFFAEEEHTQSCASTS